MASMRAGQGSYRRRAAGFGRQGRGQRWMQGWPLGARRQNRQSYEGRGSGEGGAQIYMEYVQEAREAWRTAVSNLRAERAKLIGKRISQFREQINKRFDDIENYLSSQGTEERGQKTTARAAARQRPLQGRWRARFPYQTFDADDIDMELVEEDTEGDGSPDEQVMSAIFKKLEGKKSAFTEDGYPKVSVVNEMLEERGYERSSQEEIRAAFDEWSEKEEVVAEEGGARKPSRQFLFTVFEELKKDDFTEDGYPKVGSVNEILEERNYAHVNQKEVRSAYDSWERKQES